MKTSKFITSAVLALTLVAGAAAPAFGVVANADYEDETSSNFTDSEEYEEVTSEEDDTDSNILPPVDLTNSEDETSSEEETDTEETEENSSETEETSSETSTTGGLDTATYGFTYMANLADLMNAGTVSAAEASAFFQANLNALAAYGYKVIVVLGVDTTNYTAEIAYVNPNSGSVETLSVNTTQLAQVIPDLSSYVILYRPAAADDSSLVDDTSSVSDSSSVVSSSLTDSTSSLVADSSSVASAADSSSTGSVEDTTSSNNSSTTSTSSTASSSSQASTSSNAVAKTGVGAATPVAAVLGASTVLTAALVLTAKKRKNEE